MLSSFTAPNTRETAISTSAEFKWPRELYVVKGGSCVTQDATSTSDEDWLLVGSENDIRAGRQLLEGRSRIDVEHFTFEEFDRLIAIAERFEVDLTGDLPQMSLGELRFLCRLATGIVQNNPTSIHERISRGSSREAIRAAACCYASAYYRVAYEDAFGFLADRRAQEFLPMAGDLVQWAGQLALLQSDLVDWSPKWAPYRCTCSAKIAIAVRSQQSLGALTNVKNDDWQSWLSRLILATNALVASAILTRIPGQENAWQGQREQPETWLALATIGLPSYPFVLWDVTRQRINIANKRLLIEIARAN